MDVQHISGGRQAPRVSGDRGALNPLEELLCGGGGTLKEVRVPDLSVNRATTDREPRNSLNPFGYVVGHIEKVVTTACSELREGKVGLKTAKAITGSVAEVVAQRAVLGGAAIGVGAALVTGGSVVGAGVVGIAGYLVVPPVARWAAEELTGKLDDVGRSFGRTLRRWVGDGSTCIGG